MLKDPNRHIWNSMMNVYIRWAFTHTPRGTKYPPCQTRRRRCVSMWSRKLGRNSRALCYFPPWVAHCLLIRPTKSHLDDVLHTPSPFFTDLSNVNALITSAKQMLTLRDIPYQLDPQYPGQSLLAPSTQERSSLLGRFCYSPV